MAQINEPYKWIMAYSNRIVLRSTFNTLLTSEWAGSQCCHRRDFNIVREILRLNEMTIGKIEFLFCYLQQMRG